MEGNIYNAIISVMADVGVVGKDNVSKQQGFKYRGIDAVMNALNPAMIKNRVFCTPEVLKHEREERESKSGNNLIYSVCTVKFRFYTDDGSFIEAVTVGEGMDSGDKATNKAMAIAFKYACFQVFCIPTEEMKDPDADCHDVKGKNTANDKPPASGGAAPAPDQPHSEKEATKEMIAGLKILCKSHNVNLNGWVERNGKTVETLTAGEAEAMYNTMVEKYGG